MLRALKWPLLLTALVALAACDPALPSVAGGAGLLRKDVRPPKTDVTVDRAFEQVWNDLVIIAEYNFFRIDELNKEAGVIQMGFGRPTSSFIRCYYGMNPSGVLTGKMIVQVKAKPDGGTQIKLKAHYSYTWGGRKLTFTFRTGESRLITVHEGEGGPGIRRWVGPILTFTFRCWPTHLAERTIVERIQKSNVLESFTLAQGLDLANIYRKQGRYAEAEAQYLRTLAIWEKASGPEHNDLLPVLNMLAAIYQQQQRYAETETAFLRVLSIREKVSGPEHLGVVKTLNGLVNVYLAQSKYADAESIYKRLITIKETSLGAEHPDAAEALNTLARFYQAQGRYADAESIYKRLITIKETSLGADHPDVAEAFKTLARSYQAQGRYADAESIYKRQLAMYEKALARQGIAESLEDLARIYTEQDRQALAEEYRNRSWELTSPYCYRSEDNRMIRITPKWADCNPWDAVFASRSEYAEWKAAKEAYREKFRRRVSTE